MSIGSMVKELRDSQGLTQAELAKKCYVSDVFISLIERGRRLAEINYGEDFYWKIASLVATESDYHKHRIYAALVLEDLRYRYPQTMDICIEHIRNQKHQQRSNK